MISKLNEHYQLLKAEEISEEYQVLAALTGAIAENEEVIDLLIETITVLDIIFARAKFSREINGSTPRINKSEHIIIKQGRHPFLPEHAVPLDVEIGKDYRGLIITGANAGGKTVVLKTVGLLTLMAMFGMQVPAKKGQSLLSLMRFSSMSVTTKFRKCVEYIFWSYAKHRCYFEKDKRNTLVLLDEIGSGTEPNEGLH